MDVTLPNGTVIKGVPEGTSKADIMAKAISTGMATEDEFVPQQAEAQTKKQGWGGKTIDAISDKIRRGLEYAKENPASAAMAVYDPVGYAGSDPDAQETVIDTVIPAGQGLSINTADNIYAAGRAALNQAVNPVDSRLVDDYQKYNKEYLDAYDKAYERSPIAAGAGEVGGSIAGLGKLYNVAKLPLKLAKSKARTLGYLTGEGAIYEGAKADTFEELPGRMLEGGTYGLGGGAAFLGGSKALQGLGKQYSKYRGAEKAVEEGLGVNKQVSDAARTVAGDPTPTANKFLDYFVNKGKTVGSKIDKNLSGGQNIDNVEDFMAHAEKNLGDVGWGKFLQSIPGSYGNMPGSMTESKGKLALLKQLYAVAKSGVNNTSGVSTQKIMPDLDKWGQPILPGSRRTIPNTDAINDVDINEIIANKNRIKKIQHDLGKDDVMFGQDKELLQRKTRPVVDPVQAQKKNDMLAQIRAREGTTATAKQDKINKILGRTEDNFAMPPTVKQEDNFAMPPTVKQEANVAQGHILALIRKVKNREIPQKILDDAGEAFAKGDFEGVSAIGRSVNKGKAPTAKEIKEYEKAMGDMEPVNQTELARKLAKLKNITK